MNKFKDGDWVYHEFTLGQLKAERDGDLEFSDGVIRHAYDVTDRCFHQSMDIKNISDNYMSWSKKLHAIPLNINHPDIHRWLVQHWHETCAIGTKKGIPDDYFTKRYDELAEFCREVINKCEEFGWTEVRGVRLGR